MSNSQDFEWYQNKVIQLQACVKELEAERDAAYKEIEDNWDFTEKVKRQRDSVEAGVKELEKWHTAVYSIVDGLDDPHVGLTWFDNTREACAAELEHLRAVLVPLVREEER